MNILYINLDQAVERRSRIEENIAEFAGGVPFRRIPALSAEHVLREKIPGSIRPAEKGCFLSHAKAVETSLEYAGPSLILEDDAILGTRAMKILNRTLATSRNVDILFTDLAITSIESMLSLFRLRRDFQGDAVAVGDCREIHFAASTAYVLPDVESKQKVLAALKSFDSLDLPYDLAIRNMIVAGELSASFIFPFITSLSPESRRTQIQPEIESLTNVVYDTFRKLMFNESALIHTTLLDEVNCVPEDFYDREATIFAGIWKLMLSRKFPTRFF